MMSSVGSRKEWVRPELRRIEAGSAESGKNVTNKCEPGNCGPPQIKS